jgi:hypothetical protein
VRVDKCCCLLFRTGDDSTSSCAESARPSTHGDPMRADDGSCGYSSPWPCRKLTISRLAEVMPLALRAATSFVLSLALCARSANPSRSRSCFGIDRGRADDETRARVTSLLAARDDSPGRVVGGTE